MTKKEIIIKEMRNSIRRLDELMEIWISIEEGKEPSEKCTAMVVTDILKEIGIPANIKGYGCLRDAILLCVMDNGMLEAVTKELYPEVAKMNKTTASRVERAIRHAVTLAFDRGNSELLKEIFGYTIFSRGKATNSEFIAMTADYIRLKYLLNNELR